MSTKKEFEYKLTDNLEYDWKGDVNYAKHITVSAPKKSIYKPCSVLEQEYKKAIMSQAKNMAELQKLMQDNISDKKDKKETGNDACLHLEILAMGADMDKIIDAFTLILKKSALIDNQVQMTDLLIDKLSLEDFKALIGEYYENFLLSSQKA